MSKRFLFALLAVLAGTFVACDGGDKDTAADAS